MDKQLIHEKIVDIIGDLEAIPKAQVNATQKFPYRGIDDIYKALNPLLSKHGVFFTPKIIDSKYLEVSTSGGRPMQRVILFVEYTFYATDGSSVTCLVAGEAMDLGDKATSKAMSIALKYALFQTFCIPTEEEAKNDPDRHSPLIEEPKQPKQPKQEIAQISKEKALFLRDNLDEETAVKYREQFNVKFLSKITDADFEKIIKETNLQWGK